MAGDPLTLLISPEAQETAHQIENCYEMFVMFTKTFHAFRNSQLIAELVSAAQEAQCDGASVGSGNLSRRRGATTKSPGPSGPYICLMQASPCLDCRILQRHLFTFNFSKT